jgi:hypothetical protein
MLIAHEGRAVAPVSGTAAASIAALAAASEPRAGTPLLPRERIGADFIERAIAEDDEPAPQLPATAQPSGPGLMGAAKQLLRGLGFGT